ncbi:hypothetical protein C2S51_013214, partial [Perilla frutescens var. frutescens]
MHAMKTLNSKILGPILILIFLTNTHARVHVQIINQLEFGRRMSVHCRSREDDLQYQILETGSAVEWNFKVNFFRTTLFYCDVQWENSNWYHFDAYDAGRDYRRCKSLCRWMISKEGSLYGYDEDLGFWKIFPLRPSTT